MTRRNGRRASLAHRVEYWSLRAAVRALDRISWSHAVKLGGRLGALGYRPLGIRRSVVERQIAAAFPGLDEAEVTRLARASFEHLGRVAIETALMPRIGRDGVWALMAEVTGWDVLQEALSLGRGLILVTGHLGNWELAGAYVAAHGVPLDVVVRQMNNPLFDAYLKETRQRLGMTVVYDMEAVRRATRSLKEGRAVAFVVDQGVRNLASTYVPFFGRPAKTPRGPAVFALRGNIPVVFGAAIRRPDGRFHGIVERVPVEDTDDREADVDRTVARYTQTLERWVRRFPEQYFWQHRRWKRQPADTPAELRDPA